MIEHLFINDKKAWLKSESWDWYSANYADENDWNVIPDNVQEILWKYWKVKWWATLRLTY